MRLRAASAAAGTGPELPGGGAAVADTGEDGPARRAGTGAAVPRRPAGAGVGAGCGARGGSQPMPLPPRLQGPRASDAPAAQRLRAAQGPPLAVQEVALDAGALSMARSPEVRTGDGSADLRRIPDGGVPSDAAHRGPGRPAAGAAAGLAAAALGGQPEGPARHRLALRHAAGGGTGRPAPLRSTAAADVLSSA